MSCLNHLDQNLNKHDHWAKLNENLNKVDKRADQKAYASYICRSGVS